ncbi:MAG: hypothetical protein HY531_01400 [Chloroflexi bacterium]|nr:hypothetical protein [Chloroflexota bacterium]
MYASAVAWNFKPGSQDLVRQVSLEVLIPAIKAQPGFRHFLSVRTRSDSWMMIILFDIKAHQDAALAILNPLIRQHHGQIIEGMQRYAGEVEIEEVAMR